MSAPNPHSQSIIRLWLTAGVMLLACMVLVGRAVNLQVMESEFLQSEGEARFLRQVAIPTVRGSILDRHGEPLAVSTPVDSIWAHPGTLLQESEKLPMLASLLEMPAEELERRLTQRASREFVWLERRVHPDLAERVMALGIPGVHLEGEYRRFYPTGDVTAQVLGFTNIDDFGQEGLELAYNSWLQGEPGAKRVIKDRLGRTVQEVELVREMQPGRDLQLTLDRRLQYLAFRELKAAVMEFEARSGSIVVMDVGTGEVLAMVNYPSYNPNAPERGVSDGLRNRAVTDVLEPGSVIKPFAMAAVLEAGIATPEMVVDTSPGTMEVAGHTIRDVRNYGELTVTDLLTKSSNVGIVDLVLSMDARHLWGVYSRFGFGNVTGTGFPGESAGVLRDYERWRKLEQATLAYGYGLSVTPLQLTRATAAIADGGRLRQPTFVLDTDNPPQSVLDPVLARQLALMMETVTQPGGTGTRAAIPGYRVAGKTGTSRKAGGGGYNDRYVASFTGFAPASRPRLAATVVINDPGGEEYYGGQVAAPVFARVMDAGLRLFNVPPDQLDALMVQAEVSGDD
ncbi:peptidoglycan D,D-transpeptidase FtsI family protein [Wenzhouxiangella marina]|uniref:Peptidoglycan D,D-transpeptidase FtsI n=1 Tax=Wenzhouxiangella marina TaxID=1579979 RepID=A0A0K0XYN1_9GAMM|nr:penicillin-binding transpeptidase domain-containing protein [Wenzhouxiangella marina]AKS42732.1 cell division protein [Wenzhouxiangella marina]MBB6088578.1 cell division protein FtsI (penicillin-binding protein 3) [Wenzhouxiangella marina]